MAIPLLYVYFVITFRRNYPKWAILLWCFALGLGIDIFANTPGVASASMTLVGALQPYLLELFVPRDSPDDFKPTMRSMNAGSYTLYTIIIVFVYSLVFFTLETFNFFNWLQWLGSVVGSSMLTVLLLLVIENVRRR